MTTTVKKLAQAQVATSAAALYTVPASTQAIVKSIKLVNVGVGASTIKLWQGGTTNSNVLLPAVTLEAGEFATYEGTITMDANEVLNGEAGAANAITMTVHGVEVTT